MNIIPPIDITETHKANFNTLLRAARAGKLALVSTLEKSDGTPVLALCAVNDHGEEFDLVPLARLILGDPYEQLVDPDPWLFETSKTQQLNDSNDGTSTTTE